MNTEFQKMLKGYSLVTAEILYRMPDYQNFLQTFIWQDYDLHPKFPKLKGFLDFWETKLDGPLVQVRVAHKNLLTPVDFKMVTKEFKIN